MKPQDKERSTMKILDSVWFTQYAHCIGIVKVQTYDEIKFYIGVGNGRDQKADEQFIAERGARFPQYAGESLLGGS